MAADDNDGESERAPEGVPTDGAGDDAGDGAAREPAAAAADTPKKKKKAKKPSGSATPAAGAEPTPGSAARPDDDGQFGAVKILADLPGAGTPDGGTLRDARAAFEVGDYARVRELAARLARSEEREIATAADDLLRRTGVDQVQIAFLVACALAILTIAWIYIPH